MMRKVSLSISIAFIRLLNKGIRSKFSGSLLRCRSKHLFPLCLAEGIERDLSTQRWLKKD